MEKPSSPQTLEEPSKKSPFDDLDREELIKKCKGLLVIAQKAKQAKNDLQSEIESYKLSLEKCESEKSASLANVKTLQELVDSLTEQKLNYITELDSTQKKIKSANEINKRYENELSKYKTICDDKDKNVAELLSKTSHQDNEITSLKRQNKRLEDENEQLINQLAELEARVVEFNDLGIQQREQLKILEEKVCAEPLTPVNKELPSELSELNNKIQTLQKEIEKKQDENEVNRKSYQKDIEEITQKYENEKDKKEKANVKLRSYKDKILKCANCINQLKNSRIILLKTVKEYSESIPKWQNDIINASKQLDVHLNNLSQENEILKQKLKDLEIQINEFTNKDITNQEQQDLQNKIDVITADNNSLQKELLDYKQKQEENNIKALELLNDNQYLKEQLELLSVQVQDKNHINSELQKSLKEITSSKNELEATLKSIQSKGNSAENDAAIETLSLQIKALESEKSILVKEKLTAKESVLELENSNQILTNQINKLTRDLEEINADHSQFKLEKEANEKKLINDKDVEISNTKYELMAALEKYDRLKKEFDDMNDLNNLLREEVETLKVSLEQPKDDSENLSDLNTSLQADIVKLETKLSNYKQENASLLAEIKESRIKAKEVDAISRDYEEVKANLANYKTENTELLSEMKQINQVLKERGEAISKLNKAITEMEKLIETLETDRDKVKQENEELQNKITALESDLQNATEKTVNDIDVIKAEKNHAVKAVTEKENIITALKEEIEKLKQQPHSVDVATEDNMSTSTISKSEEYSRMKDLDESFEEKYTKLRIFALKLKKKLNETTTQLQNAEQDKAKLEKMLNESHNQVSNIQTHYMETPKQDNKESLSELNKKVNELTALLEAAEKSNADSEKLKVELDAKTKQLNEETEAHKITKENLEKSKRDVKKKSVLSLEMEDYERSMKELTHKMEDNRKKMVQMESTIDTQESTMTTLKTQMKLLEEQVKAEETQNRLTKEELHNAVLERKEKDNVILLKNEIINKLEQDLEVERRNNEEIKLEMTALLGEKEQTIISLGEEKGEVSNRLKKVEFKCAELEDKLRNTRIELDDLKAEHTSYKVRAQAVLRQNQTIDHSQEELLKEENAALRSQLESVTTKLNAQQEQCAELTAALESERRRSSETANEMSRATQRTVRLQADLARLAAQIETERNQHKLQVSTLTQCYKGQISDLELKLLKETDELKKQLKKVQEGVRSVDVVDKPTVERSYTVHVIPRDDASDGEMDASMAMPPREEGEGSESAPSPPPLKNYAMGGNRSPVPLERLLEEGVPDDDTSESASLALSPELEIADLRKKLQSQLERVKHVTVLLCESERECARYAQMNELLKAEVRRARGSLERTEHAHNAEYMKNVTLKFLTLQPGDERSRLVPVLQKILTLNPEETHKLNAVAKGVDPNANRGWGSYLPWPGGK